MAAMRSNLAEQALDNLVNQFARPLDFLRELVQNAIDAGSPRVEVRVEYTPPEAGRARGVLEIHVDDWGSGMDASIIDGQLTRLFSSDKEGDLTKIGKFGIGFTSIFAIHPELVQLKTGRHGENWELLFQADRSFVKIPLDEPVDGTKITLFKRMEPHEVAPFVEEARFILSYWCEHSDVPITFVDRSRGGQEAPEASDDPFAIFASADTIPALQDGGEVVNRPLSVEGADLEVRLEEDGVEVVVGVGPEPLYGFYNGGLTLLRTQNLDSLGSYGPELCHLLFKVKYDALEHTLTRDNVLHDRHFHTAMEKVQAARRTLIRRLIDRLAEAVCDPADDPDRWQIHLAKLCDRPDVVEAVWNYERPLLRGTRGEARRLGDAARQGRRLGAVLVWSEHDRLAAGIEDAGEPVFIDTPGARALITAVQDQGLFGSKRLEVVRADRFFILPEAVDPSVLDEQERNLLERTRALLRQAVGIRLRSVRLGDFGGADVGAREALVVDGAHAEGVFQRRREGLYHRLIDWLPSILRARHMLINRHHPLYRAQLFVSLENPWLAAAGLACAVLHEEAIEPERTYRVLLRLAHGRLERP